MEIKDIYDKYSTEQIDEFEKIAESKCCWGCKKRNKSCSDCELFLTERDNIVICDYIDYLAYKKIAPQIKGCLDREIEKDQRIAVLEKALELACVLGVDDIRMFNEPKEECVKRLTKYYIEQAEEKLLGDKK